MGEGTPRTVHVNIVEVGGGEGVAERGSDGRGYIEPILMTR